MRLAARKFSDLIAVNLSLSVAAAVIGLMEQRAIGIIRLPVHTRGRRRKSRSRMVLLLFPPSLSPAPPASPAPRYLLSLRPPSLPLRQVDYT